MKKNTFLRVFNSFVQWKILWKNLPESFKLHFIILRKKKKSTPKLLFESHKTVHVASLHLYLEEKRQNRREIKFLSQFISSFGESKSFFLSSRLNVFIITKSFDRKHIARKERRKTGKRRKSIFISLHNNLMIYFFVDILAFGAWMKGKWRRQCTLAVIVNRWIRWHFERDLLRNQEKNVILRKIINAFSILRGRNSTFQKMITISKKTTSSVGRKIDKS